VAAVVAMQRMALGMVATTRRKTRFPHGVTTVTKKAKPTTAAMAFCISTLQLMEKTGCMSNYMAIFA